MLHRIAFTVDFVADLEIHHLNRLEQMLIEDGTEVLAQVSPYVVETLEGPVEVADLTFAEGAVTRLVPFSYFRFAE